MTREEEEPSMEQVLKRFGLRDAAARRALVERYRDRVWRIAMRILGDEQEAWDVAQETFVRLLTRDARFSARAPFEAWLYRVIYNLAMDAARRRRNAPLPDETLLPPGREGGPAARLGAREDRDAVRAVLAQMPAKYRAALALREMEGLSPAEIARAAGIPSGLARWRVFRARDMFRRIWERDYGRFDA